MSWKEIEEWYRDLYPIPRCTCGAEYCGEDCLESCARTAWAKNFEDLLRAFEAGRVQVVKP